MPETAELTEPTQLHRVLTQPPRCAGASRDRYGTLRAVKRLVDDLGRVRGRVHDGRYGGYHRGLAL